MSAVGDAKVFMIMCKCLSVISSSSRYRQETVPTRDSRRDLYEILSLNIEHSPIIFAVHPARRPACAPRIPDLPREDKNLHVLFAFLNTRLLRAPRGQKQALVACFCPYLSDVSLHPRASHRDMKMHIANTIPSEYPTRPRCSCAALSSTLSLHARAFSPPRSAIIVLVSPEPPTRECATTITGRARGTVLPVLPPRPVRCPHIRALFLPAKRNIVLVSCSGSSAS